MKFAKSAFLFWGTRVEGYQGKKRVGAEVKVEEMKEGPKKPKIKVEPGTYADIRSFMTRKPAESSSGSAPAASSGSAAAKSGGAKPVLVKPAAAKPAVMKKPAAGVAANAVPVPIVPAKATAFPRAVDLWTSETSTKDKRRTKGLMRKKGTMKLLYLDTENTGLYPYGFKKGQFEGGARHPAEFQRPDFLLEIAMKLVEVDLENGKWVEVDSKPLVETKDKDADHKLADELYGKMNADYTAKFQEWKKRSNFQEVYAKHVKENPNPVADKNGETMIEHLKPNAEAHIWHGLEEPDWVEFMDKFAPMGNPNNIETATDREDRWREAWYNYVNDEGGAAAVNEIGYDWEDGKDDFTRKVKGHKINWVEVGEMMDRADYVVAHNADYDYAFIVREFPPAAYKPWLCSYNDLDWERMLGGAFTNSKAGTLADYYGIKPGDHSAFADIQACMDILETSQTILQLIQVGEDRFFNQEYYELGWVEGLATPKQLDGMTWQQKRAKATAQYKDFTSKQLMIAPPGKNAQEKAQKITQAKLAERGYLNHGWFFGPPQIPRHIDPKKFFVDDDDGRADEKIFAWGYDWPEDNLKAADAANAAAGFPNFNMQKHIWQDAARPILEKRLGFKCRITNNINKEDQPLKILYEAEQKKQYALLKAEVKKTGVATGAVRIPEEHEYIKSLPKFQPIKPMVRSMACHRYMTEEQANGDWTADLYTFLKDSPDVKFQWKNAEIQGNWNYQKYFPIINPRLAAGIIQIKELIQ